VRRYDLRDRVVFITGASRGIGRACAIEYHRAGCFVAAVARSEAPLRELARELGEDRILPLSADVTDATRRASAVHAAIARFGRIDVLVNNAGWASFGEVVHLPMEHLHRMSLLNFIAPVELSRLVLPGMLDRRSGQIVNVSSVLGVQPMPRKVVYCATKAALHSFSRGLRMELHGTGIDVILIAPGATNTNFVENASRESSVPIRISSRPQSIEHVAKEIVRASICRRREVTLKFEAKAITLLGNISSRVADWIVRRAVMKHRSNLE